MLSSYQLVFQLGDVCFVSWFTKIVGKDVYKRIKQYYAVGRKEQRIKKKEKIRKNERIKGGKGGKQIKANKFGCTQKKFSNRNEYLSKRRSKTNFQQIWKYKMQISLHPECT